MVAAGVRVRAARARARAVSDVDAPAAPDLAVPSPGATLGTALSAVRASGDARHLAAWAGTAADARVRVAALERLVAILGPQSRETLSARVADAAERGKVRAAAARLMGSTGPGAFDALEAVLRDPHGDAVRSGAVAGLAACADTDAAAATRLGDFLRGPNPTLRRAATHAVTGSRAPAVLDLATAAVTDPALGPESRVALATGLGDARHAKAGPELLRIAEDRTAPSRLREAALDAVGRIGDPSALDQVAALVRDDTPALAARAVAAEQRIRRLSAQRR